MLIELDETSSETRQDHPQCRGVVGRPARTFGDMSQPERAPRERLADLTVELARALRELDDILDVLNADEALEEPGESIPLEELEAEFGRE